MNAKREEPIFPEDCSKLPRTGYRVGGQREEERTAVCGISDPVPEFIRMSVEGVWVCPVFSALPLSHQSWRKISMAEDYTDQLPSVKLHPLHSEVFPRCFAI